MFKTVMQGMLFLLVSAVVTPSVAYAQSASCGYIVRTHDGWQELGKTRYHAVASTEREIAVCQMHVEVRVEGWIHGWSANYDQDLYVAWWDSSAPHPGGTYAFSTAKHFAIINFLDWQRYPNTTASAYIASKEEMSCASKGGEWVNGVCILANTPIIVDVANNGYDLTSPRKGVFFDLDADGEKERVAWTHPNGDEAFLVMDRNGNGRIDDGSELFGDRTPIDPAGTATAENGFVALGALEKPEYGVSYVDEIIDARDDAFSRLYLWRDANHDGESQPRELTAVKDTAIVGFGTWAKEKRRTDEHGNRFGLKGVIYVSKPNGKIKAQDVWDIWLRRDS